MSSKKLNVVLYAICCILALYGLIILIRKMMLVSDAVRQSKKELGMKFYIEPFGSCAPGDLRCNEPEMMYGKKPEMMDDDRMYRK